jgi:hypothetical protein
MSLPFGPREVNIMSKRVLFPLIPTGVMLFVSLSGLNAQQSSGEALSIGADDIAGVVTSTKGPEAGVWVIAETADLPAKFVKIVVTDDRGRYLLPQLPKANYKVWVRGYGLVDSSPTLAAPGQAVNLTAAVAPNPRAAAEYYPAIYWFSLLRVPDKSEFPGTGPKGNGIPENMKSQGQWLHFLKTDSCWSCHQIGDKATREIPKSLGHFDSSTAAWARRLLSGQAGNNMINGLGQLGPERALPMFADWTDRIATGELPPSPPRPQGAERNIVITEWDWADPKAYLHDEIATDKRNPTLNANGAIYGAGELSVDYLPVLDPVSATVNRVKVPVRDPKTPSGAVKSMSTIRCLMTKGESGLPPESDRAKIQRSAKRAPATLRQPYSPLKQVAGNSRCTIQRPSRSRSLTPVLAHIIYCLPRMQPIHYGRAAVAAEEP